MATEQQRPDGKYPLAFASKKHQSEGDRLILVLRSAIWSANLVQDIIDTLDQIGLEGRYAVLYLDPEDEAHVVRR